MPDPQTLPANSPRLPVRGWGESLVILTLCLVSFGWDLRSEPHFVDESAYISQSFYADLYASGRWDHPAWLDYAGYDLPPLPKYLIGLSLWSVGERRPTRADTHAWYQNTSRQFVGPAALAVARRPSVLLGAVGCVAIFWLGTLLAGPWAGRVAALLLAINPLYRMHARRAMSDVPAECFLLLSLVFGMIVWRRAFRRSPWPRSWFLVLAAGMMVGLATLSKLNGVLGGLVLLGWIALALILGQFTHRSKGFLGAAAAVVAGGVAFGTFVALNPYLTAHPPAPVAPELAREAPMTFLDRTWAVYDHRATISALAMKSFPHNALPTLADRVAAVAVQGFGRFGPLGPRGRTDSTIRFDWQQDWGALVWLPLVGAGSIILGWQGRRQARAGLPPLVWLALTYLTVVVAVVTPFIPLAWDRYFLSLQAPSALVVGCLVGAGIDRWLREPSSTEARL